MTTGIYILYFDDTDMVYVGQSIDIESRVNAHRYRLSKNTHCNYKLQNKYNLTQKINYLIVEYDNPETLNMLEIKWIEEFDSINYGFNITSGGASVGTGTNNSNSKYSENTIIDCFTMLLNYKNPIKSISQELGMSESAVSHISSCKQHLWLKEIFPEQYKILEDIREQSLRCSHAAKKLKEYPLIKDASGNTFEIKHLSNFCKEHKLHKGAICRVLHGSLKSYLGWSLR